MLSQKSTKLVPVIIKIQYQFIKNVSAINQGSSKNHRVVVFNSEFNWKDIYFTVGSQKITEPKTHNDAGDLFTQKLSFNFPGDSSDYLDDLAELDQLPVIVRFEYNNGVVKLIGSLNIPGYFQSSAKSDATSTGDTFQFVCNAITRALLLESTTISNPPPEL